MASKGKPTGPKCPYCGREGVRVVKGFLGSHMTPGGLQCQHRPSVASLELFAEADRAKAAGSVSRETPRRSRVRDV